jgi:hypothetical protein
MEQGQAGGLTALAQRVADLEEIHAAELMDGPSPCAREAGRCPMTRRVAGLVVGGG